MTIEEALVILNNHSLCLSGKMISKPKQKDVIKAIEITIEEIKKM
jgi:hypothetical protein